MSFSMIRRALQAAAAPVIRRQLATESSGTLLKTPLNEFHKKAGAKMVPFCGWEMPVQYPEGVLTEHLHCRSKASIFDVSHMGQLRVYGKDRFQFMESLTVADVAGAAENKAQLSVFTNEKGGIIDDTIITRTNLDYLFVVINAGCRDKDIAHMRAHEAQFRGAGKDVKLELIEDHALVALQGPEAMNVLQSFVKEDLKQVPFMSSHVMKVNGVECRVSRCGYTGEDGFEISIPESKAVALTEAFWQSPVTKVQLTGLGARDSLRLEAGLCLYGHDINEDTTPIEGGLAWTIGKRRRAEGGFPGAAKILQQLNSGVYASKRVGLTTTAPVREHTEIQDDNGNKIGEVTSGGFSPCLKGSIAMGYVPLELSKVGTKLHVVRMGKKLPATVAAMPFVPTRYYKIAKP